MIKMIGDIIMAFINMLKIPIIIFLVIILIFYILVILNIVILHFKGYRFKKGEHRRIKRKGILRRILIDAPRQYAYDLISREPDYFKYQGLIVFEGRQGAGKSIAMVEFARRMQREYPLSKCISNMKYKYQDEDLTHWKKLINYKNGKHGVIVIMDELQNWFSSNQSKNFPPEMLSVITQNRKNRRIILGTSQNFYLLAKAIRSQATEVRQCLTLAGCITFVRKREPILDSEGNVQEWKNRGFYFFVHDKELRNAYDTYAVVESLTKSGFQERDYLSEVGNIVVKMDKK